MPRTERTVTITFPSPCRTIREIHAGMVKQLEEQGLDQWEVIEVVSLTPPEGGKQTTTLVLRSPE